MGVTALLAAGLAAFPASASASAAPAPLVGSSAAGKYVVVLKSATGLRAAGIASGSDASLVAAAAQRARAGGAEVRFTYRHAVRGFSATLSPAELAAVRADPAVAEVDADVTYQATSTATSSGTEPGYSAAAAQSNPWWGLDRIDQHNLPLNRRYNYRTTGYGVIAYVIDTGINLGHADFENRIAPGFDVSGGDASDCNGHGTHVAGTIAGATYGVAKHAIVVPVRVLDCSGSAGLAEVLAGLDWVAGQHVTAQPAVANLSLSGPANGIVDAAIGTLLHDRISVVVAAGNEGTSACQFSPSRVKGALTVGATSASDTRPKWSNYGSCLDLYAPGVSIRSDWIGSGTAVQTISGTSMASPHVAGAVALYLQAHPDAKPSQVAAAINAGAAKDKVKNVSSKWPRRLLFSMIQ